MNNFLKWVVFSLLSTLIAIGIFNYVMDPYNIFQTFELQGINTSKPATKNRTSLAKTYMVEKSNAKTLIIGTSRFDVGINPESEYIPSLSKPAFNLSVPGASIYNQFRYIQHASAYKKPNTIILGLEFNSFLTDSSNKTEPYPPANRDNAFENRLKVNYNGELNQQLIQKIKDSLNSTLSNSTTFDSIKTILAGNKIWITHKGFSSGSARFSSETISKGYFSVFRDVIHTQARVIFSRKLLVDSNAFKALDDIIKFCHEKKIQLIIVIPPQHAFIYELWDKANLWTEFEKWKQLILQKVPVEDLFTNNSVQVWDFSTYNSMTTENVPEAKDITKRMSWYWEPIHFKAKLGEQILKQLYGKEVEGFGVRLSRKNICSHLQSIRDKHIQYKNANRNQMELFNAIMLKYTFSDIPNYKVHGDLSCRFGK